VQKIRETGGFSRCCSKRIKKNFCRLLMDYDTRFNVFYGIGPVASWRKISRDLLTDLRKGVGMTRSRRTKTTKLKIQNVLQFVWCQPDNLYWSLGAWFEVKKRCISWVLSFWYWIWTFRWCVHLLLSVFFCSWGKNETSHLRSALWFDCAMTTGNSNVKPQNSHFIDSLASP